MNSIRQPRLLWLSERIGGAESLIRQLVAGAAGSFGLRFAGMALSFAAAVLLGRMMGPEGYGVYAHALAIVTLMAIPTELGLPQLVVRQVARYQVGSQWSLMRGLLTRANQAVFAMSMGLVLIVGVVSSMLPDRFEALTGSTFRIALLALPLIALGAIRMAALRGLRHVVFGQAPEVIIRPGILVVCLLIGYALLGGEQLPSSWAMMMQVASVGAAFMAGAGMLVMKLPAAVRRVSPVFETREWVRSAAPFMFIGGMQIINKQLDIIMLGIFRPAIEVGLYRAAVQMALLVTFALSTMNGVLGPYFARLWMEQDRARLQRLVTVSARAILAVSLPVALAFMFFGRITVEWAFGPEFIGAAVPLGILCLGQIVNSTVGSVGLLLNMTGNEGDTARAVAIAAVSNIVMNLVLIPRWGMAGAASATAASYVIWNVYMAVRVRQRLGLDSTALGRLSAST